MIERLIIDSVAECLQGLSALESLIDDDRSAQAKLTAQAGILLDCVVRCDSNDVRSQVPNPCTLAHHRRRVVFWRHCVDTTTLEWRQSNKGWISWPSSAMLSAPATALQSAKQIMS